MDLKNTILRFVASCAAKEEWGQIIGVVRKGVMLAIIASLPISLLLFLLSPLIATHFFYKSSLIFPLRVMGLAIAPLAVVFLFSSALKGLKKVRDAVVLEGGSLPLTTGLGLLLIGTRFGIQGAAVIYLMCSILVAFFGFFVWRTCIQGFEHSVSEINLKEILDSCTPLFFVQLMTMMINWSAMLSLGVWSNEAEVGVFGAALRTAMLTSFILTSVNSIVAPKFSALFSQGRYSELGSTARNSTMMMIFLATPILLLFLVMPGQVLSLFGAQFERGGVLLSIMAIGQFVNVTTGSVGYLLIMSGNETLMRNNTVAAALFTIILNLILVPPFGAVGAAIATSSGLIVLNLGAFYLVWRYLGIITVPFFKNSI